MSLPAVVDRRSAGAAVAVAVLVGVAMVVLTSLFGTAGLLLLAAGVVGAAVMVLCLVRPEWALLLVIVLVFPRLASLSGAENVAPAALAVAAGSAAYLSRLGRVRVDVLAPFVGVAGFYLALSAASMIWATDPSVALTTVTDLAFQVAFALGILASVSSVRHLRWAVWAIIGCGAVLGAVASLQYLTGDYTFNPLGLGRASVAQIVGETNDFRAGGPVADANFFGQIMVVVLALSLERATGSARRYARLLAMASVALTAFTILITYSRGALLASAVVGLLAFLRSQHRGRTVIVAIGAVLVLLVVAPANYSERFLEIPAAVGIGSGAETSGIDPAIAGRSSSWAVATQQFADHPLIGTGIGNYEVNYLPYSAVLGLDARGESRAAHSLPLQVLAEQGVVGFLAFGAVIGGAFVCLSFARRRLDDGGAAADDRSLVVGLRDAFIGYLVAGIFLHDAFQQYLWLLLALCWATVPAAEGTLRGLRSVIRRDADGPAGTTA